MQKTAPTTTLPIVLKYVWFDAFVDGSKTEETRRYSAIFNEKTCVIGRRVVLMRAYTKTKLHGVITSYRRTTQRKSGGIYPVGTPCVVIGIRIDRG